MKKIALFVLLIVHTVNIFSEDWKAKWISPMVNQNKENTWLGFRKDIQVDKVPTVANAKIAVDSKYWLWINGELIIREGGVKRGPTPSDTYYDIVDIAPFLKNGKNQIGVLVWYFGKDGFSHNSSGKGALLFDCQTEYFNILSDASWRGSIMHSYQTCDAPLPNFRLSESSILYDAQKEVVDWYKDPHVTLGECLEIAQAGDSPWNKLYPRPIPFWKDYGLNDYLTEVRNGNNELDTIVCKLPYNAQVNPYLKIDAKAGQKISVFTDNYIQFAQGEATIRSEYITKEGVQEYEVPTWMNGHKVFYIIPKGVNIIDLKYRETGYDTHFSGKFSSSNSLLAKYWDKAVRTLYVNMRDTYMDCPDRERAQWTGDAVNESLQAFYALSTSTHALTKKWLYEIINWQKPNGQLFAPVPAGNWRKELSCQVLSTIGYYGLWNYYMNTGDKQTLSDLYDGVKRYLSIWEIEENGLVKFRSGEWQWGDWGANIDIVLIHNILYYHAVKGMYDSALALNKISDAEQYKNWMVKFRKSFNDTYWNGSAYRHTDFTGATDDRVQSLAVVIGIPYEDQYPEILNTLMKEFHASPYMEWYVIQALFDMGYPQQALERFTTRYRDDIEHESSTLHEIWGFQGSINHSWSGGVLTVLAQSLCGVRPIEPGYKTFQIIPQPGDVDKSSLSFETIMGPIKTSYEQTSGQFLINAEVPGQTEAIIGIGQEYKQIKLNGKVIWKNGKFKKQDRFIPVDDDDKKHIKFKVKSGAWKVVATK
jgi:hypothetical protein